MNVISMVTRSHEILEKNWFLPSLKDDCVIKMLRFEDQGSGEGSWETESFNNAVTQKTKIIADFIEKHQGELIIWADVDIQFFRPIIPELERLMQSGEDMLFQRGCHTAEEVCTGFFICRCTKKTLRFWRTVQFLMHLYNCKHDQYAANLLLGNYWGRKDLGLGRFIGNIFRIEWRYLPDSFYSPGSNYSMIWEPGDLLTIPENIYLHHANWTVGIENKIAQFRYVRDIVDRGVSPNSHEG